MYRSTECGPSRGVTVLWCTDLLAFDFLWSDPGRENELPFIKFSDKNILFYLDFCNDSVCVFNVLKDSTLYSEGTLQDEHHVETWGRSRTNLIKLPLSTFCWILSYFPNTTLKSWRSGRVNERSELIGVKGCSWNELWGWCREVERGNRAEGDVGPYGKKMSE